MLNAKGKSWLKSQNLKKKKKKKKENLAGKKKRGKLKFQTIGKEKFPSYRTRNHWE